MWQIVIPLALAFGCTIVPRCMGWKPPMPRNSNGWQVLDCPSNSAHHVPTRRPAPGRIGKGATGS
jgi:hypothetical protein